MGKRKDDAKSKLSHTSPLHQYSLISIMKYTTFSFICLTFLIGLSVSKPTREMMAGGIRQAKVSEGQADAERISQAIHGIGGPCNYQVDQVLSYTSQIVQGTLSR